MASYCGPQCDFTVEAGSAPFAVFRNKEGHQLKSTFSSIASKKQYNLHAWQNTLYYKQHQQDFPIPSDLLYETLNEDAQLSTAEDRSMANILNSRNSILGMR